VSLCDPRGLCESEFYIFGAFSGRFGAKNGQKSQKTVKKREKSSKMAA